MVVVNPVEAKVLLLLSGVEIRLLCRVEVVVVVAVGGVVVVDVVEAAVVLVPPPMFRRVSFDEQTADGS